MNDSGAAVWAATELAEFLARLSALDDPATVLKVAAEAAAEAFDAEVAAIVIDGDVVAVVGFPKGLAPLERIRAATTSESPDLDIPGAGPTPVTVVSLGRSGDWLMVARAGESITSVEAGLVAAMARATRMAFVATSRIDQERRLRIAAQDQALENARLLESVARHSRLEQFLVVASQGLITAMPDALDEAIRTVLADVGLLFGLDHCLLLTAEVADPTTLATRQEWAAPGRLPLGSALDRSRPGESPEVRRIAGGEAVVVVDTKDVPDANIREWLLSSCVRAAVFVPIARSDATLGVLALGSEAASRAWDTDETNVLRILGELIGGALDRRDAQLALRDANDRLRSANLDLAAANFGLVQANTAKNDFVSMTSHELRTPLTSILGFTQTLRAQADSLSAAQRDRFLAIIERQGERLTRLVSDLLDMARLEAGTHVGVPTTIDVGDELRDLTTQGLVEGDNDLTLDLGKELTVFADPDHLRRMIVNLVENAVKYGAAPVLVQAYRHNGDVVVQVRDHGLGVPEDFRASMYDKFTQASTGVQRQATGTGLGLAIVQGLARANGGRVAYQDAPGGGACFQVHLPTSASSREPVPG